MIDHHAALIYTMVLAAAADRHMTDAELEAIGTLVRQLPVFADFDADALPAVAETCATLVAQEDGLDEVLSLIRAALPRKLRETAYALGCEIVLADTEISQEELRLLEILRHRLDLDRLICAAIERAIAARMATARTEGGTT